LGNIPSPARGEGKRKTALKYPALWAPLFSKRGIKAKTKRKRALRDSALALCSTQNDKGGVFAVTLIGRKPDYPSEEIAGQARNDA
jgi:hypothetical protein